MSRLLIAACLLSLVLPAYAEPVPSPAAGEPVARLVAEALENNPELHGATARWQAFVQRARQAGSLEDPMLMLKLQNLMVRQPAAFDRDPQTAKVVGVSQALPFWGKRELKAEVARHEAEVNRWSLEERKLELARMVKETYYQLYQVDRSLEVVARNLQLLEELRTIAATKYSVGQGVQQDLFKAGLEQSKLFDLQLALQQQRRSLTAALNTLLARPLATPVGRVPDFSLPKLVLSAEQLQATARESRPQLHGLASQVAKGEASRRLAQKEYYPDFTLSAEYMQREPNMSDRGDDMFSVALNFNLPLQRERRQAMVAEANAEVDMARAELQALQNTIDGAIVDGLAQLERRQQAVELYRSAILPQAEQALESAVIGYRVNKVDFLTLLDGRQNLFMYQRELFEAEADYMMALARLVATVGKELTSAVQP